MTDEDVSVGVEKGSLSILRVVGELERMSIRQRSNKRQKDIDMDTAQVHSCNCEFVAMISVLCSLFFNY